MRKGNITSKIFGIALVFLVVGAMLGGLPALVGEAEASPVSFTVSPAEVIIDNLALGQEAKFNLTIRNNDDVSHTFILTTYNLGESERKEGRAEFPDESWITFSPQEIEVAASSEAQVKVTVAIPPDHKWADKDWEIWLGVTPESTDLRITYYVRLLVSTAQQAHLTIYVPDDYSTIQAAVDAASPGDTIIVSDGTYHESVQVDKSLTLKGEGMPVVSGVTHSVITVTADACTIDGFEITGGGCGGNDAGIEVRSDYNLIRDNIVRNNYGGIALYHCSQNTLVNNLIYENHWYGIGLCSSSCKNTLSNNTVRDNTNIGIKLYYSSNNNIVSGNVVSGSNVFGIELWESSFNTLYQNNLIDNARNARDCYGHNSWDNGFKGNYWSDYMGVDENGDGIGDTPYELTRDHGACGGKDNYPLMKPFARIWYVDDDLVDYPAADFTKIQEAVEAARSGDTIIVYPGTYTENVDVNKDHLTIKSENGAEATIVQAANPDDHVFEVTADYVEINGFTAEGAIEGSKAGIYLASVANCNVRANNASNNDEGVELFKANSNILVDNITTLNGQCGILMYASSYNIFTNNIMSGNANNFWLQGHSDTHFENNIDTSNTVDGKPIYYMRNVTNQVYDSLTNVGLFYCISCEDLTIEDLTLTHNGVGIFFWKTHNSRIEKVISTNNHNGICLLHSNGNTLVGNTVSRNTEHGILVRYSAGNIFTDNACSNNIRGISLYDSSNNIVTNNVATSNGNSGICLIDSPSNTLRNNTVSSNYYGISLGGPHDTSSNNTIYFNNFIDNAENVCSSYPTNTWNSPGEIAYAYDGNTYTSHLGNYWSHYAEKYPDAEEIDSTGIWDTPYSIDSDADNYPLVEPFGNYEIGLENQPPVADAGPDQSASSGDLVYFDGSNSYDPDGTIVSYEWDFGDGETAGGHIVSHRFRGAMNEPRIYIVTLTVEDDSGCIATDTTCVTVTPLEKTVEVSHQPAVPIPGQPVFGKMTVSYNWIHDSMYVVSKICYESEGFLGVGAISIWDFHSHELPLPIWTADIFSFGSHKETTYYPDLDQIEYGGDTFEGIAVDAFDVMNIFIEGWAGISVSIGPSLPVPFFETNSACFQPDYTEVPDHPVDIVDMDLTQLCSPGEVRVYDPEGRVTGLVDGEVKGDIPHSAYDDGTIIIVWSSSGLYRHEVEGTDEGIYGLDIASTEDGETTTFGATNTIVSGAVHEYTIDWDVLAEGGVGVTIKKDFDGDGNFDEIVHTSQPNTPSNPSPSNDAANVSLETDLSWTGGDPDAENIVTYNVYFGTNSTPPFRETIGPYAANQTSLTYDSGALTYNTTYYWRIVASDNHGVTKEGPLWDFTTGSQAGDEDNPDVATGLASLEGKLVMAYGYKFGEGVGGWTVYNPEWAGTHPDWNSLTTLHVSRGYWINVKDGCDLTYEANTYELDEGWNLIGWCGATAVGPPSAEDNPNVATGLDSIKDKLVIAYGYKAGEGVGGWTVYNPEWAMTHPDWNTLITLYVGRGYWINVSQVCSLEYGTQIYGLDEGWNLIGWLGA